MAGSRTSHATKADKDVATRRCQESWLLLQRRIVETFKMFTLAFYGTMLSFVIACKRPKAPLNSGEFYSSATFVNGTTVDYVCDPGYALLGQQRRTCDGNGRWNPPGVPYCVADVATKKPRVQSSMPPRATDDVDGFNRSTATCTATEEEVMPWWFVDLQNCYRVQIIRASLAVNGPSPVSIAIRVGDDSPSKSTNEVCSKVYDFVTTRRTVYLPCTEVLVGRYVSVHVESVRAVSLQVCNVSVYSDQVAPVYVVDDVPVPPPIPSDTPITVPVMTAIVVAVVTVLFLLTCAVLSGITRYRGRHSAKGAVNQGVSSSASTDALSSNVPHSAKRIDPQLRSLVYTSSLPGRNVKSSGYLRQGAGRKMGRSVFTISETELRSVRLAHYNESPLL